MLQTCLHNFVCQPCAVTLSVKIEGETRKRELDLKAKQPYCDKCYRTQDEIRSERQEGKKSL